MSLCIRSTKSGRLSKRITQHGEFRCQVVVLFVWATCGLYYCISMIHTGGGGEVKERKRSLKRITGDPGGSSSIVVRNPKKKAIEMQRDRTEHGDGRTPGKGG